MESARQQLEGLKRNAQTQQDATKQKFSRADSGSGSAEYQPRAGDSVRLLSMKGAQARVGLRLQRAQPFSAMQVCALRFRRYPD